MNKNIVFSRIFTGLGVLFILDFTFLMLIRAVTNLGTILPIFLGVAFFAIGKAKQKNIKILKFKNLLLKRIIVLVIVLFAASFIIIEGLVLSSMSPDRNVKPDYLIILGAGLKGDKMTLTFQNRVDKALDFLRRNQDVKVIVSGGQGEGEIITEAEAMKIYLMKKGITENRIIKEEKSTSTLENFKFSRPLITGENQKQKLLIVTSDFHMFRAKILAERNGYQPYGLPSKTWVPILPNSCLREYFAVIKSLIFDK